MAIRYYCRHCGYKVGEISDLTASAERLGFHHLTDQERLDMLTYQANGDIDVKTICEDCHEALHRNPDFHQLRTFIQ
ncbi:anti-sigma-F factor Fin family protein [Bacillus tianshenii]|nr:anti-sigma-F factor Fin family protein [Bacillus tianshenii]